VTNDPINDVGTLVAKAHLFRSLHDPAHPLALANVWDAGSAAVVAAAGAPAVATTSAGTAWARGLPDGDHLDREDVLDLVHRIVAVVDVPVTVDVEAGYGDTPADVETTVDGILAAGAVGINVEDGDRDPALLVERIRAARRAADRVGVPLFVNARTDVFLFGLGPADRRTEETLDRARWYVEAGADGIFVPGTVDPAVVTRLAAGIPAPLNVMAGPGAPTVKEFAAMGVARVSTGSAVAQAAYAVAREAAEELLGTGSYECLEEGLEFGEANGLFTR
jgi:2-methylisocitrate lyase-like PEP mutase family enzyme